MRKLLLLSVALAMAVSPVLAYPEITLSAELDKGLYKYGEVLTVTGSVMQGGVGVENATVIFEFIDPDGNTRFIWAVLTGDDGGFTFTVRLPSEWPEGEYTLSVWAQYLDEVSSKVNLTFTLAATLGRIYRHVLENENAFMILPNTHGKPALGRPEVGNAAYSDWTAAGYVGGLALYEQVTYDTNSWYIDYGGKPNVAMIPEGSAIILFGGPVVNIPVWYYERVGCETPVYAETDGVNVWFVNRSTGSPIPGAQVSLSELSSRDIFVIELFQDSDGRYVFMSYGIGWTGTFASALYFDKVIWPNIDSYNRIWYIVEWVDNGNGDVDPPGTDTYNIVAQGPEAED